MKSKHFTVNSKTYIVVQFIPKIKFINNPKLTRWCSFLDCDPILVTRDSDSDVTSEDVTKVTNYHHLKPGGTGILISFV